MWARFLLGLVPEYRRRVKRVDGARSSRHAGVGLKPPAPPDQMKGS